MNIDVLCVKNPSAECLPSLKRLWAEAFSDTEEFIDCFFKTAFSPERCLFIKDEEGPLSVLYWFDAEIGTERAAYLYGIATAKRARGKGLCKFLMEKAHKILADSGYSVSLLVPAHKSLFAFYERLGYIACTHISEFCASASGCEAIELKEITKGQYALARRKALPTGSVIQEGASLDFLEAMGRFYQTEGAILFGYVENGRLICREYIGELQIAGRILASLGLESGSFRTAGNANPFCMCCALSENALPPKYFGLAFD